MTLDQFNALVTTIALVAGGGWALYQWRDSLAQRRRELRWKQAEAAHELMDQVFEDEPTGDAFEMIDGELDSIEFAPGERAPVTEELIRRSLNLDGDYDPVEAYVRHRMDNLLYHFERIEHSVETGLVAFSDVATPTSYYVERLAPYHEELRSYAERIGFRRALAFLDRFPEWSEGRRS